MEKNEMKTPTASTGASRPMVTIENSKTIEKNKLKKENKE